MAKTNAEWKEHVLTNMAKPTSCHHLWKPAQNDQQLVELFGEVYGELRMDRLLSSSTMAIVWDLRRML